MTRENSGVLERERDEVLGVPAGESKEGGASGTSTFIFESSRPPLQPTSEPLKA